jgi:chromosome segregation ATPase
MNWLNDQKPRGDVSSLRKIPATIDKSRVKPEVGNSKGTMKKGKVIRFAAETRDERGWNNRSTASSDRSSSIESGAASESFRQALSEIDELIVRDEQRSVEKNSTRYQFELEESREMNRVLAEQLQLLHRTVTQAQKGGAQNVLEKKYITMKKKLSSITCILEDVTTANQALLNKNEVLQSQLQSGAGQTNATVETEDREALHSIIASLTTKVEEQKQEKMSLHAAQARAEAKATAQKNSIDVASTQVSDLNARNTALEIEIVSLKDQLQDSKEAIENEAKEKQKLTKQISDLFEDLDDMTETSKGLMARNEKLVFQICDFSEEESRSCQQEQNHQQESQKTFMADIRARKLALQNKVANLNSKLSDAMLQAREKEGIVEEMKEMERNMETRASTHQSEMVVVSTEMSELKARKSALEVAMAGLTVRLENAHKEINVTRKDNASLIEEARRSMEIESKKRQEPKASSHLRFNDWDHHIGKLERNKKVLEDEKAALQTKYESCCAEFDFVNNSNRVLATKNRELQTQNCAFQKEASQCREEMEAKRAMVAALASKVEDLQVQRMELIGDKASVETQVTVERNSMIMASTQIAELDARNTALELEISELADKLDSNENENEMLKQKESDARKDDADKRAMRAKIEVLQNERKALSEDRNRIEAESSVHKNSWQIASQQNADLSARNAGLETEIDDLKIQSAGLLQENAEMRIVYESKSRAQEEWTELQTQHDECCSKLDLTQETNKELARTNKEMESQVCMQVNLINQLNHESQCKIRNLENFNGELKNKSLNLQEQHDRMESAKIELQAKYELSRSDVTSLTRKNKSLGREVEQQDSQFQILSKEIVTNGMKGNHSAMTSIISALNRKVEHLQEEKNRLFETQASIEAQSTVHRNSMVVATTQITELWAKKGALETEISEHKVKLNDASKEIQTAHDSMSVTQSTLNSINKLNEERQTKLDELMHENDELAQKNETLTNEQSELYASHNELVEKYESCCTELESLQAQFQTQKCVKRSWMAMASTQISELSARNSALEIDIANLNDQSEFDITNLKDRLQIANQEIQATSGAMSTSVSVYTDKLGVLNQLNKECQFKINELENSKAALVQESASSKELRAIESASTKELRATLEDCKGQLVDETYSNGVYKGLISQLNEMNDELKTQHRAKEKEIESLQKQNTDLTEQTKESARMKDKLETLSDQKNEVDQLLANLEKTLIEIKKDRDVARDEENHLSIRVDDLVKTEDKLEKTLKDWKRVSKGKMRQLNFMNTNLEKSNQEKTKEIERLRVRIMRRR